MVLWKEINLAKITFVKWEGLIHLFKLQGFNVAARSIVKTLTIPGT